MTVDLEEHAEAIMKAAGSSLRHYTMTGTRAAILTACTALFEAGALAMQEAAASCAAELQGKHPPHNRIAAAIRAIDPATLKDRT
jgi:hypothetical protein